MSAIVAPSKNPQGTESGLPQPQTSLILPFHVRGFPCHPRGIRHFVYPILSSRMVRASHSPGFCARRKNQILRKRAINKKRNCSNNGTFQSLTGYSPMIKSRPAWNRQDAKIAAKFEKEHNAALQDKLVRLEFTGPRPTEDELRSLYPNINKVMFGPERWFCDVTLKSDVDPVKFLADINNPTELNPRCTHASLVNITRKRVSPDDIDPTTLYIGNIPLYVKTSTLQILFPTTIRLDLRRSLKNSQTRYAFVRFNTVKETIDAFEKIKNLNIEGLKLIFRFKRLRVKRTWDNMVDAASDSEYEERMYNDPSLEFFSDCSEDDNAEKYYSSDEWNCWYDAQDFELEFDLEAVQPNSLGDDGLRFLYESEVFLNYAPEGSEQNAPIVAEDVVSVQATDDVDNV